MSIQLNNALYTLLTTNTGLTAIVGTKVFPLIIPANTVLPAIVIERDFMPEYTSDGAGMNESNIEITVLSSSYNQSIQIAVLIDGILNSFRGTASNIPIVDSRLVSCTEGYQEEAYIQKLMYVVKNY
jgi:hypothetical protein